MISSSISFPTNDLELLIIMTKQCFWVICHFSSIYSFTHPSIHHPFIHPPTHPSIHSSIQPSIHASQLTLPCDICSQSFPLHCFPLPQLYSWTGWSSLSQFPLANWWPCNLLESLNCLALTFNSLIRSPGITHLSFLFCNISYMWWLESLLEHIFFYV